MRRHPLALAVASALITAAGCSTQTTGTTSRESTPSAPSGAISSPIAPAVSVPTGSTTVDDNANAPPQHLSKLDEPRHHHQRTLPVGTVAPITTAALPTSRGISKSSTPVAAITAATKTPPLPS